MRVNIVGFREDCGNENGRQEVGVLCFEVYVS